MPTLIEVFREAEQLKRDGKTEEAIAKYEEMLQIDESNVIAHLTLAMLLDKVGRCLEAVKHGERAVELEPTEMINYTTLSTIYRKAFEGTGDRLFILKAEDVKQRMQVMQWQR